MIMESVYGYRVMSLDDPYIALVDRAMEGTAASAAGGAMVDFFPFRESTACSKSCCADLPRVSTTSTDLVTLDVLEAGSIACKRNCEGRET